MERRGTSFFLNEEDERETDRLMQVAEDVETGKMDKADIGDDGTLVSQVVFFCCCFFWGVDLKLHPSNLELDRRQKHKKYF